MASAETNKQEIDRLTAELGELTTKSKEIQKIQLSLKKSKLPARAPPLYSYNDPDFSKYARNVENYLSTMSVEPGDRVQVLLSFLDLKSYNSVTRVYDVKIIADKSFDEAVKMIAAVVEPQISQIEATVKLLNIKQDYKSLQEFIVEIDRLGLIAFPDETMAEARDSCMSASIIANIKNRKLSFELYKLRSDKKNKGDFRALTQKALELEAVTRTRTDEEVAILDVSSANNNRKSCYICGNFNHSQYFCPERQQFNGQNCHQSNFYYNGQNVDGRQNNCDEDCGPDGGDGYRRIFYPDYDQDSDQYCDQNYEQDCDQNGDQYYDQGQDCDQKFDQNFDQNFDQHNDQNYMDNPSEFTWNNNDECNQDRNQLS
jgi:hypothetical protein